MRKEKILLVGALGLAVATALGLVVVLGLGFGPQVG